MIRFVTRFVLAATVVWSVSAMTDVREDWPALPTTGFVAGRPATQADFSSGNAIFSTDGASSVSDLKVPQYVWWRDDDGQRHPRVLVQAELVHGGMTIVGLRDSAGNEAAATLPEVELLGTRKPE
ncbi:hypothetical protein [uncultured Sphingomonas sp.]|uniref:hypothetical protein n=1 Tax=uncultured Sphingomonas sp. TaxID=158754 RepID=UPI0025D9839C|nr:hypothetical protein [uncultured Sphingomonas sp.]